MSEQVLVDFAESWGVLEDRGEHDLGSDAEYGRRQDLRRPAQDVQFRSLGVELQKMNLSSIEQRIDAASRSFLFLHGTEVRQHVFVLAQQLVIVLQNRIECLMCSHLEA